MSFHKRLVYAVPVPYVRLSVEWIPIFVSNKRSSLRTYRMLQDVFEVGTLNFLHTHALGGANDLSGPSV